MIRVIFITTLFVASWTAFAASSYSGGNKQPSDEYLQLRAEAEQLMGANDDLAQRAMFYVLIYLESGKRYDFGLSAAWGITAFEQEMEKVDFWPVDISEFRTLFRRATQAAFVDNYANYYFAGRHPNEGPLPEMPIQVSVGLQQLHQSILKGLPFDFDLKHRLYGAILEFEQPIVIQPFLDEGFSTIRNPITRFFLKNPPPLDSSCVSKPFVIKNFMNARDRINGELSGHLQIYNENAFDCILAELINRPLFPEGFRRDPLQYTQELRKTLLGH